MGGRTSLKSSYLTRQFSQYPGFFGSSRGGGALAFSPASTLVLRFSLPGAESCSPNLVGTVLRLREASRRFTRGPLPNVPPRTAPPPPRVDVADATVDVIVWLLPDAARYGAGFAAIPSPPLW